MRGRSLSHAGGIARYRDPPAMHPARTPRRYPDFRVWTQGFAVKLAPAVGIEPTTN